MLKPRQKQILDSIFTERLSEGTKISCYDELNRSEIERLKRVSNHETLWSDTDRYLFSKFSEVHCFASHSL